MNVIVIITKGWLKKKCLMFGETLSDLKSTIRRNLGFPFTSARALGLLLLVITLYPSHHNNKQSERESDRERERKRESVIDR